MSAEAGLTEGSCGGGNGTRVHTFTAPATGYYLFTIDGDGSKTLYLRSACEQPATELACTRNFGAGATSIAAQLEEGDTTYVFTDRFFADDPAAPYTLTVSAHQPNRVIAAEVYLNRSAGSLSLTASGLQGSGAPSLVSVDLTNADGETVSLDPIRNPFNGQGGEIVNSE